MCCATAVSVLRLCQLSALGNIPSSSNQKVVVFFCYSFKKCRELRGPVVGRCLTFSSTALLEIPGERVRMEWKWRASYPLKRWLKPRAKWAWQSTMGKSVLLGQSRCHVLQLRCWFGEGRKGKVSCDHAKGEEKSLPGVQSCWLMVWVFWALHDEKGWAAFPTCTW